MIELKNISSATEFIKYLFYIIVIVGLIGVGFYIGRKTIKIPKPEQIIEYVPSEPVHDTTYLPKPYKVTEPIDTVGFIKNCIANNIHKELWPTKIVTEYLTKDDSTAIFKDWATERLYKETLFDADTLGKCDVGVAVKYNRVEYIDYEFAPVTKVVENTVYVAKSFSPIAGTGILINPFDEKQDIMIEVNGGFIVKDRYGFQLKYQRGINSKDDYIGASVLLKF